MSLLEFKDKKFEDIISSMVNYMNYEDEDGEEFDCGYTQADIDKCAKILDDYIDELIALKGKADADKVMNCVKKVILALNELADSPLIETDQREHLCQFIEDAAIEAGLPKPPKGEDITYEWREW